MATGKRFYWLKLKREFMMGDEVDFLMSQKNGANYVVLYQMLCFATINTQGEFVRTIGEAVIPYDIDKITREGKWFDRDTVIVALELYKKLGLVYEQKNGVLQIANFEEIVGTETDWAKQKANQRRVKGVDNVPELSTPMSTQEIRDKSLEYRDKNSIIHTTPAHAREEKESDELLSKGERAEALRQRYIGGSLGQGVVMMNDEQFTDLCERLSIEELERYFNAVTECENSGKHYRKKTHYQAILDMAAKDRGVKK